MPRLEIHAGAAIGRKQIIERAGACARLDPRHPIGHRPCSLHRREAVRCDLRLSEELIQISHVILSCPLIAYCGNRKTVCKPLQRRPLHRAHGGSVLDATSRRPTIAAMDGVVGQWLSVPATVLALGMTDRRHNVPRLIPGARFTYGPPVVYRRELSLDALARIRDRKAHYERGRMMLLSRLARAGSAP